MCSFHGLRDSGRPRCVCKPGPLITSDRPMLLYSSVMSASAYELVPLDDSGEISWRFFSLVSKVREPDNAEVKSGHNGTCGG